MKVFTHSKNNDPMPIAMKISLEEKIALKSLPFTDHFSKQHYANNTTLLSINRLFVAG